MSTTVCERSLVEAEAEPGFTLVELLIVILIVGILAAVGVPLYLGYTKDARLAEGKALAGSALTAIAGLRRSAQGTQARRARSRTSPTALVSRPPALPAMGDGRSGRHLDRDTDNAATTLLGTHQHHRTGTNNSTRIDRPRNVHRGSADPLQCSTTSTPPASETAGDPC